MARAKPSSGTVEPDRRWLAANLLGLGEAAELLEMRVSTLSERRRAPAPKSEWDLPRFPKPVVELRCGPVFLRSDVEAYAELNAIGERGRFELHWRRTHGRPLAGDDAATAARLGADTLAVIKRILARERRQRRQAR
jgi:hypothetical protein